MYPLDYIDLLGLAHLLVLRSLSVVYSKISACGRQAAIEKAEKGDFSGVQRVLRLLESPFDPQLDEGDESGDYLSATPDWAADLVCTCSS